MTVASSLGTEPTPTCQCDDLRGDGMCLACASTPEDRASPVDPKRSQSYNTGGMTTCERVFVGYVNFRWDGAPARVQGTYERTEHGWRRCVVRDVDLEDLPVGEACERLRRAGEGLDEPKIAYESYDGPFFGVGGWMEATPEEIGWAEKALTRDRAKRAASEAREVARAKSVLAQARANGTLDADEATRG